MQELTRNWDLAGIPAEIPGPHLRRVRKLARYTDFSFGVYGPLTLFCPAGSCEADGPTPSIVSRDFWTARALPCTGSSSFEREQMSIKIECYS